MTNPVPYTVSYSFGGFQSSNPTAPLPAGPLDNEFANAAAAVATLVSAIKDIRRSDGKLNNGIVTFDSFEAGLQLLLDPTNGQLVAAAVATAQAAQTAASGSAATATAQAVIATAQAIAAAAAVAGVNLSLYLAKANNLAGLGNLVTSRGNLGLGTAAILDVGALANNIVQLDAGAKIPAYDGSQLINIDVLPVGSFIWSTGSAALPGTIKANGALISRASFARLTTFALGGGGLSVSEASWSGGNSGAYSTGDLSTTIRVPDMRGEFIRGFDDGRGVDSARALGSRQTDLLKSHQHTAFHVSSSNAGGGADVTVGAGARAIDDVTGLTGGTETRPRNVPLVGCIKY